VISEEHPPEPAAAPPPSEEESPPAPAEPTGRPVPVGRLVLGLVLVGIGVIWLLQALDVVTFSLLAVLPAALILVGVALIAMARTRRHGGLITLGIVLTVILTIASGFDIRLEGGVGDRIEQPTSLVEVQREYHLSVGQLTINLRHVHFVGSTTKVKASVGIGQLTVRVPNDILVIVHGHVGAGQVMLFGPESSGLDVDRSVRVRPGNVSLPGESPSVPLDSTLTLELSVGLGQIEVTQ